MKKIFIAIVLLVITTVSYSQSVWRWGVKAGADYPLSSTKVNVNGTTQGIPGTGKFGEFVGAFIELSPKDSAAGLRLQMEVNYNIMSMKYSTISTGKSSQVNISNLQQINIPLLVRIYATPKFSINAGPSINVNLTAKNQIITTDGRVLPEVKLGTNSFKPVQLGAIIGGAYQLTKNWFVDLRYNYLFGHINNSNGNGSVTRGFQGFTDDNSGFKVKWSELQLGVGYTF